MVGNTHNRSYCGRRRPIWIYCGGVPSGKRLDVLVFTKIASHAVNLVPVVLGTGIIGIALFLPESIVHEQCRVFRAVLGEKVLRLA